MKFKIKDAVSFIHAHFSQEIFSYWVTAGYRELEELLHEFMDGAEYAKICGFVVKLLIIFFCFF